MGTRRTNLIGERFEKLLVIKEGKVGYWLCLCDCGNKKEIRQDHLQNKKIVSCGCDTKDRLGKARIIDITGNIIGRLRVLKKVKSEKSGVWWLCECECGNIREYSSSQLRGNCNSCGCLNLEKIRDRNSRDISGERFGMLVVGEIVSQDKNRQFVWECICDCGNTTTSTTTVLLRGAKSSCGCLKESLISHELKKYCVSYLKGVVEYSVFRNPKTKHFLPFDIYIPEFKLFIEVHGNQHYYYMRRFHINEKGFKYSKHRDKIKKEYAMANGNYLEIDLRKIKSLEDAIKKVEEKIYEISVF